MIRINLLPTEGKKARPVFEGSGLGGPSPVVLLGLLLILAMLAVFGYVFLWLPYSEARKSYEHVERQRKEKEKDVVKLRKQFADLGEIEKMAKSNLEILNMLDPVDRLLWSEKLNILSDLRPPNIYIRKIKLTEEVKEIETAASVEQLKQWDEKKKRGEKNLGSKPEKITRPIITQTLQIDGISHVPTNLPNWENVSIKPFLDYQTALVEHKPAASSMDGAPVRPFLHGLEEGYGIKIGDWKKEQLSGTWVMGFTLSVKAKPQLEERDAAPDAERKGAARASKSSGAKAVPAKAGVKTGTAAK